VIREKKAIASIIALFTITLVSMVAKLRNRNIKDMIMSFLSSLFLRSVWVSDHIINIGTITTNTRLKKHLPYIRFSSEHANA
jgi:hypothetical protein